MQKTSCVDLGGPCDEKLSADSWSEMVNSMSQHVMESHPDIADEVDNS